MASGSTALYKVRRRSSCQGETEFYCNSCKHDLRQQCKERRVIELRTKHHDVEMYREIYNILEQDTCMRHIEKLYEKYCDSCKFSFCDQCKKHQQLEILDIRTAYKTIREQHRDILQRIRSGNLYNEKNEIFNVISKMTRKAQRLKDIIVTVMCDYKIRMRYKCLMINHGLQRERRTLARIENYEHRYEQSANRAVRLLFFIKNVFVPNITPYLTKHALLSLPEQINKEDVVEFLSEVQIIDRGERQVRDVFLLELESTPVVHRTIELKPFGRITHISCLNADRIWISVRHSYSTVLILTNTEGNTLYHHIFQTDYSRNALYGEHTVNNKGELIYVDTNKNIHKLSPGNGMKSTLIKGTDTWQPLCVYFSPANGDLLVGMFSYVEETCKVNRYNITGQYIQAIQHDNKGQRLYRGPKYIVENNNGDVIVSDFNQVVVTDDEGKYRFTYTGIPSGSLIPRGICTDLLSHILVCDHNTNTLHIIDKDGNLLSQILTRKQGLHTPYSVCYDNKTHFLWVGSWEDNTVCVYKYLTRECCRTGTDVADQSNKFNTRKIFVNV